MGWWGYRPPKMYCGIEKNKRCKFYPGRRKTPGEHKCKNCSELMFGNKKEMK